MPFPSLHDAKHPKAVLAAGAAGIAVAAFAIVSLVHPSKDREGPKVAAVPVVAVTAQQQDFPITLSGVGTVAAFNTVDVHVQVTGTIQKIAFTEGQTVHAGDLLAQVDPRPYQAALAQAEANLARDKASAGNAERDLKRYEPLAEKGFASSQQLETQRASVEQSAAAIKSDDAAISNARTNLGYTSITAPIDGITGLRNIDAGNIIQPSDTKPVVTITQIEPIAVVFTLPSQNIPAIQTQMAKGPLIAAAYDQDNKVLIDQGQLAVLDNQVDPKTGTVRLKAVFPNKDHKLWPGAFANVQLTIETRHDGVTIPSQAIQHGTDGIYVYVVMPNHTVESRPVTLIEVHNDQALITAGLKAGDQVVVDGQARLGPGAPVTVVPQAAAHDPTSA